MSNMRIARRSLLGLLLFIGFQLAAAANPSEAAVMTCGAQDLPQKMTELLKGPAPHYAVFTSNYNLQTGETWCPDCRRSVPAVLSAMEERGTGSVLLVQVGARDDWKGNPDHPLRRDPDLKLTGVPTLIHYTKGGDESGRLGPELEACTTSDEAKQLVAEFIAKTAS